MNESSAESICSIAESMNESGGVDPADRFERLEVAEYSHLDRPGRERAYIPDETVERPAGYSKRREASCEESE